MSAAGTGRRAAGTEPTQRLFVACDLPAAAAAAVERWQAAELAPHDELRVVHTLHVTLCFLGGVAASRVADITAALGALALPALPTSLGEALFLPEQAPSGSSRCTSPTTPGRSPRRSGRSPTHSSALGVYTPERRPWLAHLTVARYRRPGHPFSLQNVTVGAVGLPSVILYASHLERGGAVHTPLATFPAPAS